jgi:hypothetical protein
VIRRSSLALGQRRIRRFEIAASAHCARGTPRGQKLVQKAGQDAQFREALHFGLHVDYKKKKSMSACIAPQASNPTPDRGEWSASRPATLPPGNEPHSRPGLRPLPIPTALCKRLNSDECAAVGCLQLSRDINTGSNAKSSLITPVQGPNA